MKNAKFFRFVVSAFAMLLSKMALQSGLETINVQPYLAYGIVHVIILFMSYGMHLGFTFGQAFSWASFKQYFRMVAVFKVIDYALFAGVFTFFDVSSKWAIMGATLGLFLVRFGALDKSFSKQEPENFA